MGGGNEIERPTGAYPALASRPVGQWISNIYLSRLSQFTDNDQWKEHNLIAMLDEGIAEDDEHVKLSSWSAPGQSRPTFEEAASNEFRETHVGETFGPAWSTHWFRVELRVPDSLRGKKHLEFHWDAHNEGLVWSADGKPLQGLTGDGERVEWILPDSFRNGRIHTFYVEMACNGMFGNAPGDANIIAPPDPDKTFRLTKARIVAVNLQARGLLMDMRVICDAAREFPPESWQQHRALKVATTIIDTFKVGDQQALDRCREIARGYLGPAVDSPDVYDGDGNGNDNGNGNGNGEVFGIGHCHIDSCWLWPWAETKRKVARSWTNQCNLMERYPELRFACSQAQQYKWLEQGYPHVFERVREQVRRGAFCPVGGSWVEHDTNMPSGESLVRQFLYGQRYFRSRFGSRCRTFWLPDTFGYAAQLPQLCRLAGMDRFVTQKLSWNNVNKFPHTTFNWVALDGSQVLCHMPPSETYTADANFGDVNSSVSRHKSMDHDHTSLLIFGKGDGGGGPTWEHIEKLRRCRGLSDQVGLLPRVRVGLTVDDFFDRLEPEADALATWYGELYFELHRGTYTTQAKNKKNNRASENLLRDVELLATTASLGASGYRYPKKEIDEMWEAVLLCQFHDCLPGSSIEMCYNDSDELYAMVSEKGKTILQAIHELFSLSPRAPTRIEEAVAVNTLPWRREEIVRMSGGEAGIACGSGQLIRVSPFPGTARNGHPPVTVSEIGDNEFVLRNAQLHVRVRDGVVTSLFDVETGREAIAPGGRACQYTLFDDKPIFWQAWDVEVYHLDTRQELSSVNAAIVEEGPSRVSIRTETRISPDSWIRTTISLSAAIEGQRSYVECDAEVEWHEAMKFLKVEFPVDVRNTEASYETAFGVVRRPTHYNTTWDMAKFEVCCHRFADLSEHNFGVSVLNDSKYGFATCGNLMRLSLLRSPKAPDAHADMGRHRIRWAILPHAGALSASTVRAAFQFNNPLRVLSASPSSSAITRDIIALGSPVTLDGDESLVLDTVKRGEDDQDVGAWDLPGQPGKSVVLRIYDSLGGRGTGTVRTTWDVKRVFKTNLLEDLLEEIVFRDGGFAVALRPFEVATYQMFL